MSAAHEHATDSTTLRRPFRLRAALALGVALALVGGCMHPGPQDPARVGPFFTPRNYVTSPSLAGIRRVVVLPVWAGENIHPESIAELDPVVIEALQHEKRFEVVTFSRDELRRRFRVETLPSTAALPHDLLTTLQRESAADAVLFVDVTVYRAHRPMALGLRGKLATIDGTRLLWTFDEVYSTNDPKVVNGARNFYLPDDRIGVPADLTLGVLRSPTRFAAYATASMFTTLPPVWAAALTESSNLRKTTR